MANSKALEVTGPDPIVAFLLLGGHKKPLVLLDTSSESPRIPQVPADHVPDDDTITFLLNAVSIYGEFKDPRANMLEWTDEDTARVTTYYFIFPTTLQGNDQLQWVSVNELAKILSGTESMEVFHRAWLAWEKAALGCGGSFQRFPEFSWAS
ncbi:hypothetical protein BJX65DRAFT_313746 [Aspergillus insuetus]